MKKFRVRYARIVVLETVVEAESEGQVKYDGRGKAATRQPKRLAKDHPKLTGQISSEFDQEMLLSFWIMAKVMRRSELARGQPIPGVTR